MRMNYRFLFLTALIMPMLACTTQYKWPSITEVPTQQYTPGRWVWADLVCDDAEQAKQFYSQVFGWHFNNAGTAERPYLLATLGAQPVAGVTVYKKKAESERAARWIKQVSVTSVASAAKAISEAGGNILIPEKHLPGRGDVALVADPEGALFGLIHSENGDPVDVLAEVNTFIWQELWANDAMAMAKFYSTFAHYNIEDQKTQNDIDEINLLGGDELRAGIIQIKRENIASAWLPYIRVTNLQQTLEKVSQAHGDIIIAPSAEIRDGKIAVITDSQGAALGLVEWSENL